MEKKGGRRGMQWIWLRGQEGHALDGDKRGHARDSIDGGGHTVACHGRGQKGGRASDWLTMFCMK